jgi:hypothetical protein
VCLGISPRQWWCDDWRVHLIGDLSVDVGLSGVFVHTRSPAPAKHLLLGQLVKRGEWLAGLAETTSAVDGATERAVCATTAPVSRDDHIGQVAFLGLAVEGFDEPSDCVHGGSLVGFECRDTGAEGFEFGQHVADDLGAGVVHSLHLFAILDTSCHRGARGFLHFVSN